MLLVRPKLSCNTVLTTIVTGGAGTLGLACARAVLEHGASGVCIWDLESTLRTSMASVNTLASAFPDRRVFGIAVDVTDRSSIQEAVDTAVKHFGSISHLYCFAGVVGVAHAASMPEADWRRTIDINTTGSFLCAQAVANHMFAEPGTNRSITLTASISGHSVNFPQPQVAYNVSKAAVIAMKSSLAAEWAHAGIRVNSISPGYMDTILNEGAGLEEARQIWNQRNPMGRMGAVGELDGVCVLLASRAGTYINGADFVIDGGSTVF